MIELYLRPLFNRLFVVSKTAILSTALIACFASSHAQTLVPELVFTHAQLKTGYGAKPAGADGAVYFFPNVTTDVDAIITITGRSSSQVTLSNVDLTGPNEDPVHGTGYDNAWQPRVAYNGGSAPANASWWMEFQVSFAQHSDHSPTSVNQFYVTGLDVDGDGQNLHEYLCFYKQLSYTLEQNSDITPVSYTGCLSDVSTVGREYNGPCKNYPNITTSATDVMVTNYYTNTNSFIVRIGAKTGATGSSASDRMNSLWFKSFAFNIPVVSTLPLTLTAFTAQKKNSDVTLHWETAMETNASHFTIQRSIDGATFDDDAIVFAEGNSDVLREYSYTDKINGLPGHLVYYRLKMVDMDAKYRYSKMVVVRLADEEQTTVVVFPNPATHELRITIPVDWQNRTIAYNVYNSSGILVRQKVTSNAGQTEILPVADLPAGIYIIKTANGNKTTVQKFIKS
ncbi:MAG: T9SS type A sorting domain-containing protein [Bacteroidetes bacterium]|nr:T9SS type A sorting domain-containing protein [Bacteroidota bacterium]